MNTCGHAERIEITTHDDAAQHIRHFLCRDCDQLFTVNEPPRILVVVAMHQLCLETVQRTFVQDWDAPLDFLFLRGNTTDDTYQAVTDKYNRARDQVLAGGYDAMLTIEADMIVPPDALTKLAALGADVAYGLYCWRHPPGLGLWNCYPVVSPNRGFSVTNIPEEARACWGQIAIVAGLGLGCTLIQRQVLEAGPFHHAEGGRDRDIPVHCDWMLSEDCQRLGFTQAMDLSVVCGHIMPGTPRMAVWPDPAAPGLFRIDPVTA